MDEYGLINVLNNKKVIDILEHVANGRFEDAKSKYPKSTFYTILRSLENIGLVKRTEMGFEITSKGFAYLMLFKKVVNSFKALSIIFNSFPEHKIIFPEEFYPRLHELLDLEVVTATDIDLLKPHKVFINYLVKSSEIYGVSPIFYPDYPEVMKDVIKNVKVIELILTEDIADVAVNHLKGDSYWRDFLDKIHIYKIDFNPYIAFTVTDVFLSIGFYRENGSYDFSKDLISTSESAIKFGKDLFNYYKEKAVRIL